MLGYLPFQALLDGGAIAALFMGEGNRFFVKIPDCPKYLPPRSLELVVRYLC